ncbi:rab15 effector protein [Monodelphis domestica]|uniref:RAB15 effector protein n=1 Tax=Monodelphis domestica TaxID=13616 RepID=A0A5F8H465_MONDO|nr:rab15 effector protein [Monodelphis domestica]
MGQTSSQEVTQKNKPDLVMCDIFSRAVIFAAQKLKDYLGFVDPLSKLSPDANTLNEIFLIHFISFCHENGMDEKITTNKMTKNQALLFGADWIWTFWGSQKEILFQLAVQTLQMSTDFHIESIPRDLLSKEAVSDVHSREENRFEKMEEFCNLIGEDCLGLFIIFGVPGKPKDIRGVLLDSIKNEKIQNCLSGEKALKHFILNTKNCLSTKELLENYLCKNDRLNKIGKVYINFL